MKEEIKLISIVKENGKTYWFTEDGKAVCGAKCKNGNPDMRSPVKGSNRCVSHGGKMNIPKKFTGTITMPDSLQGRYVLTDEQASLIKESIKMWITKLSKELYEKIRVNEYVGG